MSNTSQCEVVFVPAARRNEFPACIVVPQSEYRHDRDDEAWEFDVRIYYEPTAANYQLPQFKTWVIRESRLYHGKLELAVELLAKRAASLGAVKVEIYEIYPPPTGEILRWLAEVNEENQKAKIKEQNCGVAK